MRTLLDRDLEIEHAYGTTRCHVLARAHDRSDLAVVCVSELPSNPGPSITVVFGAVANRVRSLLPAGMAEPVWVERWPARALAALLLHDAPVRRDHLRLAVNGGWHTRSLTAEGVRRLLQD
jgi:hypothetical protein